MTAMKRHLLLHLTIALFAIRILPASGDIEIPPFAKEILEKKGISIADLQNDPELRKKWLRKFRDMGGNKQNDKTPDSVGVDLNPDPQFYKVITENNLFRPLGYRKEKPGPPFELIATVVNHESSESKALIRSNTNQQVYYVGVGEEFAGAKIELIEPLKVMVFHRGKSQEFRASTGGFLGGGGHERKHQPRTRNRDSAAKSEGGESNFGRGDREFEGMERKLRHLPPEERRKFMREMMRKRREASGGKRRGNRGKERAEKEERDDEDEKKGDNRTDEKKD